MTADLWLPGFEHRPLKAGGPYDDTSAPKLGWHTWEGMSWAAAESAFRPYPPHIGAMPPHPGAPATGKRQYVPLNRHAYAFAGSENDDEYIIQVEVAGFATDAWGWTDQVCEWLAVEIVDPIARATGVPPVVVPCGFRDPTNYRPSAPGHYLASAKSDIRLTPAQLRAFSGHLGHQHMPAPDVHWDPGRLPIDRILKHTSSPQEDDDMADVIIWFNPGGAYKVSGRYASQIKTQAEVDTLKNFWKVPEFNTASTPVAPDTGIRFLDGPLRNVANLADFKALPADVVKALKTP